MMNDLLLTMSEDMGIDHFSGEMEDSFAYRVIYSALGQWCLRIASSVVGDNYGTTKHNQTIILNDLLDKYSELFPSIVDTFKDTCSRKMDFSILIRKIYEETGYLLTDDSNRNRVANYGRSIPLGTNALFFGLPHTKYSVNGLGVFTDSTTYTVSVKEFLIRDNLTYTEYINACFDPIDFEERDIDLLELEFFNPLSSYVPSRSWEKQSKTDYTIARKGESGPYYRVMDLSGDLLFMYENPEQQRENFTSYEYRRLYLALKAYYKRPLKAIITKIDKNYSTIRIGGYLPNREYYFLLLLSWPVRGAFDKTNFLVRNNMLQYIISVLENLGILVEGAK